MRALLKSLSSLCLTILILSGILLIPASGGSAWAQSFAVVVPAQLADVEAGGAQAFPINCGLFGPSMRYQQVYAGSALLAGTIFQINFRLLSGFPPMGPGTLEDVTITLSTTQAEPGALSATFADNVGPDATTVFLGDLPVSALGCVVGPCPFDVEMPFEATFPFDPEEGNLLVDFTIPSCVDFGRTFLDATNDFPNITSRAGNDSSSVSSTANFIDDTAVITEFNFIREENIPTLSEWGMIAAAAGLVMVGVFFAVRQRLRASEQSDAQG